MAVAAYLKSERLLLFYLHGIVVDPRYKLPGQPFERGAQLKAENTSDASDTR